MENENKIVEHIQGQPISIKISRGPGGRYDFDVSLVGSNYKEMISQLTLMVNDLNEKYPYVDNKKWGNNMENENEYVGIKGYKTPKNSGRLYLMYNDNIIIYKDASNLMGENKVIMEISERKIPNEKRNRNFVAISFDKNKIDYIIEELKKIKDDDPNDVDWKF